jgi:predicted AlkP superfamily phosphohydrolase/phosphomutase/tetratricopeptide (TPR) repeat protein
MVGWDAADWKVIHPLIEAGQMPNLQRLVENGASGQVRTLHPPLSPMLWTSIATGKRPFKHGILGFSEPAPDGRGVQPVTNLSRKAKALWNILNQNDLRSIVIGWWPSHPAEPVNGVMVSDHFHRARGPLDEGWPLLPNAIHPPELAATLADLRVHPDRLSPEMVEPFIPLAREIDQDQDSRLGQFMRTLAEGMSVQSAATWLIDNRPWDFFAVYYDSIDHFCHGFMKYHPPRQSWIPERDFELYHNVISMAYQFHDRMLGTLLEKAGTDVTVIVLSDHGFHPDHLRPASIPDIPAGPAIEHRDLGILAMSGPGIKKNESLHGPSVLDIAPTILALYGLPAGEDMDGKVLSQAFAHAPEVAFIPSWDEVPGPDGRHPPHARLDPAGAHEALEQMVALGYIEKPSEDAELAVAKTLRELRYNLGEAYQDASRHVEAREIFSELRQADPDESRFAVRLFASCQALGLLPEMRRIVEDLEGRGHLPVTGYLKAQVLTAEKRYAEALAALELVAEAESSRPALLLEIAGLYLRLKRWREARQAYQEALSIDPDNVDAHIGLCRIALRRRKFGAAAQSALDALQRKYHSPQAHFLLGIALMGMKEYERAAGAFRAAISLNPNFPEAHVRLAALLEKYLGEAGLAREHRRFARRMRRRRGSRPEHRSNTPAAPWVESGTMPPSPAPEMPPLEESVIVVTGLPRSGTSMLMQMLAAGGIDVLSDGSREADEQNPRGYLEFAPVKNLLNDSKWLFEARGKAVKIVAPLLSALPQGLPCRVIIMERSLDEILDSQQRMLANRNQSLADTPQRRRMLKDEYSRILERAKVMLSQRPDTQALVIGYRHAISDPLATAKPVNDFLGGGFDVARMAAAIDPALYRQRAPAKRYRPAVSFATDSVAKTS